MSGGFLCGKNGRDRCDRAGVQAYCLQSEAGEKGSPNLQIIFDPVNLLDICNYKDRDAIIAEAIDVLGEDIAMVHIKDFKVENNSLVSVAAGTGEMNYDRIIRFMKERKPYIHATLENTVPENAVASRKYIQRLWEECHVG